jgi:hypothetical protein
MSYFGVSVSDVLGISPLPLPLMALALDIDSNLLYTVSWCRRTILVEVPDKAGGDRTKLVALFNGRRQNMMETRLFHGG